MQKAIVRTAWLCACLSLAACGRGNPFTVVCPDILVPAIVVDVRDAATGAPLTEATLTIRDGARVATGGGPNAPPTIHAGESAGTYDVRVSRAGYLDWTRDDVRVGWRDRECGHPETVHLTADMVRAP